MLQSICFVFFCLIFFFFFFFFSSRRRHTRWNCDWSSDVCSSDLKPSFTFICTLFHGMRETSPIRAAAYDTSSHPKQTISPSLQHLRPTKIGRASCRERV